jgi:hypothetical protein
VPTEDTRPRWLRDLTRFLPLKSQFVLTGNVRDLQIRSHGGRAMAAPLADVLAAALAEAGYAEVIRYDPLNGFTLLPRPDGSEGDANGILTRLGLTPSNGRAPAGADLFGATIERLVALDGPPVALIADFASRLIVRNDALSPQEQQLFTRALVLGQTANARPVGPDRAPAARAPAPRRRQNAHAGGHRGAALRGRPALAAPRPRRLRLRRARPHTPYRSANRQTNKGRLHEIDHLRVVGKKGQKGPTRKFFSYRSVCGEGGSGWEIWGAAAGALRGGWGRGWGGVGGVLGWRGGGSCGGGVGGVGGLWGGWQSRE